MRSRDVFLFSSASVPMLYGCYWYYLSKFVDFLDTVFFVLNKKNDHISLLHVVHHSLMPVSMWYGMRFQPGGHNTLMSFLNSIVHTVMYLYYLLAALGPRVRPYLWWKKYLTSMQIIQFVTVMAHSIQLAFSECDNVPRGLTGGSVVTLASSSSSSQTSTSRATPSQRRVAKVVVSPALLTDLSSGISSGVSSANSSKSSSSGQTVTNGVADTACKTLGMCEQMALRSRLGAI
ncbi:hypothetical protein Pcinc_018726 [Petrolisthes cinctipes]|uniref:Elongation of very long chain fatty acids protein n=1 Tax=Petrolisthes cinctipes TaxID=88211 RepID=A0AAE1KNG9_PETCI|nr:hypothetical protein Pcinc_018726 [Petrolisthes cinctipes]